MARGRRAGRAYIEIYADNNKLSKGLNAASTKLKSFAKSTAVIGASLGTFGVGLLAGLASAGKQFASLGDNLDKMSLRTGIAVKWLSEMDFIASQTGTSLATVEGAVRKMQRSIADAGDGLATQQLALKKLNLTYEDLANLSPSEQFDAVTKGIAGLDTQMDRVSVSSALFGRAGTQLIPMLSGGADAMDEMRKKANSLGLVLDKDAATKAAVLTDALDRMDRTLKNIWTRIGEAVAPQMAILADVIAELAAEVGKFIKENKELVLSVAALGVALTAVGAGFITLASVAAAAGMVMGGIASGIGALVSAATVIAPILSALAPLFVAVAVAAAGVAVVIKTFPGIIPAALEPFRLALTGLRLKFEWIGTAVKTAMADARAAFASGGIKAAIKSIGVSFGLVFDAIKIQLKLLWAQGLAQARAWAQQAFAYASASLGVLRGVVGGIFADAPALFASAMSAALTSIAAGAKAIFNVFATHFAVVKSLVIGFVTEAPQLLVHGLVYAAEMFGLAMRGVMVDAKAQVASIVERLRAAASLDFSGGNQSGVEAVRQQEQQVLSNEATGLSYDFTAEAKAALGAATADAGGIIVEAAGDLKGSLGIVGEQLGNVFGDVYAVGAAGAADATDKLDKNLAVIDADRRLATGDLAEQLSAAIVAATAGQGLTAPSPGAGPGDAPGDAPAKKTTNDYAEAKSAIEKARELYTSAKSSAGVIADVVKDKAGGVAAGVASQVSALAANTSATAKNTDATTEVGSTGRQDIQQGYGFTAPASAGQAVAGAAASAGVSAATPTETASQARGMAMQKTIDAIANELKTHGQALAELVINTGQPQVGSL